MKDPITAFVEQSQRLLAEFTAGSPGIDRTPNAGLGAAVVGTAQHQFIADFTRLIEDLLDSLHDQGTAVSALLAPLLLECCEQTSRLTETLIAHQQSSDATLIERGRVLRRRIERSLEPSAAAELTNAAPCETARQNTIATY